MKETEKLDLRAYVNERSGIAGREVLFPIEDELVECFGKINGKYRSGVLGGGGESEYMDEWAAGNAHLYPAEMYKEIARYFPHWIERAGEKKGLQFKNGFFSDRNKCEPMASVINNFIGHLCSYADGKGKEDYKVLPLEQVVEKFLSSKDVEDFSPDNKTAVMADLLFILEKHKETMKEKGNSISESDAHRAFDTLELLLQKRISEYESIYRKKTGLDAVFESRSKKLIAAVTQTDIERS